MKERDRGAEVKSNGHRKHFRGSSFGRSSIPFMELLRIEKESDVQSQEADEKSLSPESSQAASPGDWNKNLTGIKIDKNTPNFKIKGDREEIRNKIVVEVDEEAKSSSMFDESKSASFTFLVESDINNSGNPL